MELEQLSRVGLAGLLGLRVVAAEADEVRMELQVGPQHHQPDGIVHGGVYCAIVETGASIGGAVWYGDRGLVVGVVNSTDFYRAVRTGTLTAVATPLHRGRSQQVWVVEITDEQDRRVARGQVRLQNLPQQPSEPAEQPGQQPGQQPAEQPGQQPGRQPGQQSAMPPVG